MQATDFSWTLADAERCDLLDRRSMMVGFRNGVIGGAALWLLIGAAVLAAG